MQFNSVFFLRQFTVKHGFKHRTAQSQNESVRLNYLRTFAFAVTVTNDKLDIA